MATKKTGRTFNVSYEIGFHVDIEIRAESPEHAIEEGRKIIQEAKGGAALLELCQTGELNNWNGYLRGIWDHKTMLDQE